MRNLHKFAAVTVFFASTAAAYEPPARVEFDSIIAATSEMLARPDIPVKGDNAYVEDIIRIDAVGMQWDIGMSVHEPDDASRIAVGADGKKVGIFLLHGGSGHFKSMHRQARILSSKFGYKVVCMSFPGRHAYHTEDREWPGSNVREDGSVRTPIWLRGEEIGRDEYEIVMDTDRGEALPNRARLEVELKP